MNISLGALSSVNPEHLLEDVRQEVDLPAYDL